MMLHLFLRSCSWVMVAAGPSGILNIVTTGGLVEKKGSGGKRREKQKIIGLTKHNTCYICMKLPKHKANTSQQREFSKS